MDIITYIHFCISVDIVVNNIPTNKATSNILD